MRSMMSNFPTEKVQIIKQDTSVIEDVDALVSGSEIHIHDATLNIEEGDIIERILPSGAKEQFRVLDRGFYKGAYGIPDHYQIQVERVSEYTKIGRGQIINQYHITNAEKVNIQSTDNSTTFIITANDISLMEKLKKLASGLDNEQEITANVEAMQDNIGKGSFIEKYNAFIQSVANHMTIFSPFIPALSALLTR